VGKITRYFNRMKMARFAEGHLDHQLQNLCSWLNQRKLIRFMNKETPFVMICRMVINITAAKYEEIKMFYGIQQVMEQYEGLCCYVNLTLKSVH
jgi:hypothetical protein